MHELVEGVTQAFYAARDGRYWCVTARHDPMLVIFSSWVVSEPEIMKRMAESFRVIGVEESAASPESDQMSLT